MAQTSFARRMAAGALREAAVAVNSVAEARREEQTATQARFEVLAERVRVEGANYINELSTDQWQAIRKAIVGITAQVLTEEAGTKKTQEENRGAVSVARLATFVTGHFGGMEEHSFEGSVSQKLSSDIAEFLDGTSGKGKIDFSIAVTDSYMQGSKKALNDRGFPVTVICNSQVLTPGSDGACDRELNHTFIGIDVPELIRTVPTKKK